MSELRDFAAIPLIYIKGTSAFTSFHPNRLEITCACASTQAADKHKQKTMRILVILIIGFFFATCMLLVQPLYILWPPPLLLPFVGGFILSWVLRWRGWFAYLGARFTTIQGGFALLVSIVAPVLIGIAVTFLEVQRLELPAGIVELERSIGPDGFHIIFLAPEGIDALKSHFQEHHGIQYWHDVPTPDTTDDPNLLVQSVTPSQSQELWILLNDQGEQTFVEIGGPHGKPEPVFYVVGTGLLILIAMIVFGPPRLRIRRP